jgi:hypothetical protein
MTGKPVTDGYRQVDTGAGKKLDSSELTVAAQTVERERALLSDPVALKDSKTGDFTESLDNGLLLRSVFNAKAASAFWLLADEVHKMRVAMEEAVL